MSKVFNKSDEGHIWRQAGVLSFGSAFGCEVNFICDVK